MTTFIPEYRNGMNDLDVYFRAHVFNVLMFIKRTLVCIIGFRDVTFGG